MLYWFMKRVFAPIIRSVYRPKVEGLENVPATGQVILASNHLAFVDSIVIPMVMPRRVNFLAKAEYFQGRGIKGALMRGFFGGLGHIPVERGSGRAARAALDTAEQVLNGGGAFAIYPEGTRSLDGRLYRGHAGVARIALATGAPVVPVALIGTDQVQRNGRGHVYKRQVRHPAGLLALRGHGRVHDDPPRGHRRDHVRDPGAVRPGVRGQLPPPPQGRLTPNPRVPLAGT